MHMPWLRHVPGAVAMGPTQSVPAADESNGLAVGPAHAVPEGVADLLVCNQVDGVSKVVVQTSSLSEVHCNRVTRALSRGERLCTQ